LPKTLLPTAVGVSQGVGHFTGQDERRERLPGEADLQQEMRGIACSSVGGRWISDLKATTPVAAAARHVLTVRLGVVRDQLPFALHEADKDPEHVHRFRVGTRRARAALDSFA